MGLFRTDKKPKAGGWESTATQLRIGQTIFSKTLAHHARKGPARTANRSVV